MSNPGFYRSNAPVMVKDIVKKTGSVLRPGSVPDIEISTAAPIEAAFAGAISFLDNQKYVEFLKTTSASAVICNEDHAASAPDHICVLIHRDPYNAYAEVLHLLYPTAMRPQGITGETGLSAGAHICDGVEIERDVLVEAGCVIGSGSRIGSGSHILAGAIIGSDVCIGRNCTISHNACITHTLVGDNVIVHPGASIGQDGFGFAMGPDGHKKVPQIGRVIIQDNVEIGANTTIDRGANRDTIIGEGTKIDNLVQIGHNVTLGRHCVIVGLVGISGSATLGDFVVVAGQAGIVGHVSIGAGAQIGGGSGVHNDVAPGEKVMGYPSIPAKIWMRHAAKIVKDAKNWRKPKKKPGS